MIAPNAESALNEEAGKLLLEDYDSYYKHAKLITSVHAQNSRIQFKEDVTKMDENTKVEVSESDSSGQTFTNSMNNPMDVLSSSPKKRISVESKVKSDVKKRTLRRL